MALQLWNLSFRYNNNNILCAQHDAIIDQIPSFICIYEDWTINYTVTGTELDPDSSASGMFNHRAAHTQSFSILHGLLMNQNYSLTIVISTDSGKSSITASTTFGKFNL